MTTGNLKQDEVAQFLKEIGQKAFSSLPSSLDNCMPFWLFVLKSSVDCSSVFKRDGVSLYTMQAISSMVEMFEQEILYNLPLVTFRQIVHLLESLKLFSFLAGLGKIEMLIAISASQT